MNEVDSFKRALQALAQPASVQVELFPDFVAYGDELVLDYGEALERFGVQSRDSLTRAQRAALADLDSRITELSGPDNEAFWLTRDALFKDPRWEEIRQLAKAVLREFGWPNERPGPSGAIYVSGDDA